MIGNLLRATGFGILVWVFLTNPGHSADKALILNDQEQAAMFAIFDAAIKASGLSQISRNAMILQDKLSSAGVVTEHKDPPADPPKEPAK